MSKIFSLRIDVTKLDKTRLFPGKNGAQYLDCVFFENDENDQWGNCGMITQSVTKEERANKVRGAILGNGRIIHGEGKPRPKTSEEPKTFKASMPKQEEEKAPWE